MSEKINIGIIGIVGHGAPSEDIVMRIMEQSYNQNHNHTWEPVKSSTDVMCSICGVKAMRSTLRFNESEGK